MLPEPRPDFFTVGLRLFQTVQRPTRKELKTPFRMDGREGFELRLYLKQEHKPVRVALITVLADKAGEMQVAWLKVQAGFFAGLAAGAGIGGFAFVRVQFAAARTPETAIRLLGAFEQEDFIALVEAVEQRGDFVGQLHAASETGTGNSRKKPETPQTSFVSAASVHADGCAFMPM